MANNVISIKNLSELRAIFNDDKLLSIFKIEITLELRT